MAKTAHLIFTVAHGFARALRFNVPRWSPRLPGWALPRGSDTTDVDAAFAAGIALKSLDDLIRADPPWLGCWRDRLALKSATVAARMVGRDEEESAIRGVVLLTAAGDDTSPVGNVFFATRMLTRQSGMITAPFVKGLAALLGINWHDSLASMPDMVDSADQSGRAAPFAMADLITAIRAIWPLPCVHWTRLNLFNQRIRIPEFSELNEKRSTPSTGRFWAGSGRQDIKLAVCETGSKTTRLKECLSTLAY